MALSRLERERIKDSRLKIKSVANSRSNVPPEKVPDYQGIQDCLEDADKSLTSALRETDREERGK